MVITRWTASATAGVRADTEVRGDPAGEVRCLLAVNLIYRPGHWLSCRPDLQQDRDQDVGIDKITKDSVVIARWRAVWRTAPQTPTRIRSLCR